MTHRHPRRKFDRVFLSPFALFLGAPILGWLALPDQGRCGFDLPYRLDQVQRVEQAPEDELFL
jgi:hypothetical protein